MREYELADVRVKREDLHAGTEREGEEGGGGVEAVARRDERRARLQCRCHALLRDGSLAVVLHRRAVQVIAPLLHLRQHALGGAHVEDAEDGARRNAGVHVGRAVERIKDRRIPARLVDDRVTCLVRVLTNALVLEYVDGRLLLLRRDHAHLAREAERPLDHVVGEHVERLLLLSLHVDRPAAVGVPHDARDVRPCDEGVDGLARRLDRRDERLQVIQARVGACDLAHVPRQRDASVLTHLGEDWDGDGPLGCCRRLPRYRRRRRLI
mmetsp:Transcript_28181/g.90365  ORF Transcript_28181/g.90365 Transcript_28181/m.90365 type:complete len:267 (+) Transcript_28181:606-1406(+)